MTDSASSDSPAIFSQVPARSDSAAWQAWAARGLSLGRTLLIQAQIQPTPTTDLARRIDHTLLRADATREDVGKICREARDHDFATVCINSGYIPLAEELLRNSRTLPIAVVGFPLGACTTASKVFETREAIHNGAREIDMVLQQGALKAGDYGAVYDDILQVVEASKPHAVKVILETASLNEEQKILGCLLSKAAGAAFVKTSTGFGSGGATAKDISLMRKIVGPKMGVKASGGIRNREDALRMLAAGADRIGASSSVAIVRGTGQSGAEGGATGNKATQTNKNGLY